MQEADALRAFKKRLCKPVLININKYLTMEVAVPLVSY